MEEWENKTSLNEQNWSIKPITNRKDHTHLLLSHQQELLGLREVLMLSALFCSSLCHCKRAITFEPVDRIIWNLNLALLTNACPSMMIHLISLPFQKLQPRLRRTPTLTLSSQMYTLHITCSIWVLCLQGNLPSITWTNLHRILSMLCVYSVVLLIFISFIFVAYVRERIVGDDLCVRWRSAVDVKRRKRRVKKGEIYLCTYNNKRWNAYWRSFNDFLCSLSRFLKNGNFQCVSGKVVCSFYSFLCFLPENFHTRISVLLSAIPITLMTQGNIYLLNGFLWLFSCSSM